MKEITKHYLICALWAEGIEAELNDIDRVSVAEAENELEDFLDACKLEELDLSGLTQEQIGHDFWLTRTGAGAGFWDRGLGKLGDQLTELCKPYGSVSIYEGDDGKVYLT